MEFLVSSFECFDHSLVESSIGATARTAPANKLAGRRVIKLGHLFRDLRGNVAVPGAAIFVVIISLVGGGLDILSVSNQKAELQDLADHAALAAVQEMAISSQNEFRIKAVAAAYAQGSDIDVQSVNTNVDLEAREATVNLTAKPRSHFAIFQKTMSTLAATATARLSGRGGNICMIGLSPVAMSTLRLRSRARITAESCAVYSNSTSSQSMSIASTAEVKADLICVAGGYQGGAVKGKQDLADELGISLLEDCTPIDDPLSLRSAPTVGACRI